MEKIKLYAGALYNKRKKKINCLVASVTAATTIFAVSLNGVHADKISENALVKTSIIVEDTINDDSKYIETYIPLLGDKSQSAVDNGYDDHDLTNILEKLDSSIKEVVVYDTAWVVNDNKFERTIDTYYLKEDTKNYHIDELGNIKSDLVDTKYDVKPSLRPVDAPLKESLKNIHIEQDTTNTKYNVAGFTFQTVAGMLIGFLPSCYAIVRYFEYRKYKRHDVTDEEFNDIKTKAMLEYDNILYQLQKDPTYLKKLSDILNSVSKDLCDEEKDVYNALLDCYQCLTNGETRENAKLFTLKRSI